MRIEAKDQPFILTEAFFQELGRHKAPRPITLKQALGVFSNEGQARFPWRNGGEVLALLGGRGSAGPGEEKALKQPKLVEQVNGLPANRHRSPCLQACWLLVGCSGCFGKRVAGALALQPLLEVR